MNLAVLGYIRLSLIVLVAAAPALVQAQANSLKSPNVSANALFLYRNSNFHQGDLDEKPNGLDVREAELAYYSDVDPYSRLFMVLSVHPQYDSSTGKLEQSWVIEPEELFAESDHVPNLTLKIGKFKAAFGKHNQLHTHAYPLTEAPLANSKLLGDEGLNDVGLSGAGLLPLPWFSEVTAQYLRGAGENVEFSSPTPGDAVGLLRWKNLLDLNDASTLEAGVSAADGRNSLGGDTVLTGADLTYKWRPVIGGKYQSALFGIEYIHRTRTQRGLAAERGLGLTTWGQYQFAERWSTVARYETIDMRGSADPLLPNILTARTCLALNFNATEFSSFRLEYDMTHGPQNTANENNERAVYLQGNFTIGAHPAHSY